MTTFPFQRGVYMATKKNQHHHLITFSAQVYIARRDMRLLLNVVVDFSDAREVEASADDGFSSHNQH